MGAEIKVTSGDSLPGVKDLLPHQAAARLGCDGSVTFLFNGSGCAVKANMVRQHGEDLNIPAQSRTLQREESHVTECDPVTCAPSMDIAVSLIMDALRK